MVPLLAPNHPRSTFVPFHLAIPFGQHNLSSFSKGLIKASHLDERETSCFLCVPSADGVSSLTEDGGTIVIDNNY